MKTETKKLIRHPFLLGAGILLVIASVLLNSGVLEAALVSDPARRLGWGATLFRSLLAAHGIGLILASLFSHLITPLAGPERQLRKSDFSGKALAILIGLSILALGLRMWRLETDLWHDEVLTLVDFVRMPFGDILTRFPSQNQHMLYSLMGRLSFNIFGESAWALRLPSVLFGIASLWALFLLGRRMIGENGALLACGLMTVSYHHIWFSQNARGYMGLLFFTLLATWLWLEALDHDQWRYWIGYAFAVSLGAWLHLTMAFVAAAHVILSVSVLFNTTPEQVGILSRLRKRPLVAWLLCGSLTLQLHALALPEFLATGLHEVSLPSEWTNPLWVVTESLRSLRIGFSGAAVVLAGGVMIGIGWLSISRRDLRAGLSLVLPAILAGGTMLLLGHNLWPRFFFFSMGFGLLIVIRGAIETPRLLLDFAGRLNPGWKANERFSSALGIAMCSLIICASAATLPRNYMRPKQDFTGAREFVERNRQPGDTVVTVGLAAMDYGRYYAPKWSIADEGKQLDAIGKSHQNIWLVYTLPVQLKAYHPEIWEIVDRDFEIIKVFPGTLGGGEVFVCKKIAASALVAARKNYNKTDQWIKH